MSGAWRRSDQIIAYRAYPRNRKWPPKKHISAQLIGGIALAMTADSVCERQNGAISANRELIDIISLLKI